MIGTWKKLINEKELLYPILNILNNEYRIHNCFPSKNNVFKIFNELDYNKVRVVILGQDPYPQSNKATGIAFANPKNSTTISPSLRVIRDKVCSQFNKPKEDFDITLESWVKQGIFLLNTALTVIENTPDSHTEIWKPFTQKILSTLSEWNPGIIYVLLGKKALDFEPYINIKNNYILKYYHPAYFVRRGLIFDCTMFTDINNILQENNNLIINF